MEAQLQQLLQEVQELYQAHSTVVAQLQTAQQEIAALHNNAAAAYPHHNIKTPKPPVFSGRNREPTPQNWAHQMQTYLESHHVNLDTQEAVRISAGYLADSALTWYRLHLMDIARGVAAPYTNWEDLKTALINRFTPISPERTARQKLTTLRQRQSARTYAQEFNLCMLELPDMDEKDRIHRFMEGLKPEVRIHVELKNPVTLAETVAFAIQTDSLIWQVKKGPSLVGRTPFRNITTRSAGPTPMELDSAEPITAAVNTNNRTSGKENVRCYYCNKLGHYKRDCLKRKKRMRHVAHSQGN